MLTSNAHWALYYVCAGRCLLECSHEQLMLPRCQFASAVEFAGIVLSPEVHPEDLEVVWVWFVLAVLACEQIEQTSRKFEKQHFD